MQSQGLNEGYNQNGVHSLTETYPQYVTLPRLILFSLYSLFLFAIFQGNSPARIYTIHKRDCEVTEENISHFTS